MPPRRKKKGRGNVVCEEERTSEAHASSTEFASQAHENEQAPASSAGQAREDEMNTESEQSSTRQESETDQSEENVATLDGYPQQSLTLHTPLAKRPDYGSRQFKTIGLIVNYFPLEFPSGNIYHYDIMITLKRRDSQESTLGAVESDKKKFRCLNTRLNRRVFSEMLRQHKEFDGYLPAYDGKRNLYTKNSLKGALLKGPLKVELPASNNDDRPPEDPSPRGDIFEVLIKPVDKKETNDNIINLDSVHALCHRTVNYVSLEAVMALETILRNGPCLRHVPLGRSFFPWPHQSFEDMHPLGGGKEIWFGYHQSVILTEWQPIINIDVTATTFLKSQSLISFVREILHCTERELKRIPFLTDAQIALLTKKLKGVRVKATHLSYDRQYRIIKFTRETARKLKFLLTTGGGANIIELCDYFSEKYGIELEYRNLPCVQVQPEHKQIYLPLEVCKIVAGQHVREPLCQKEASKMIKITSLPPEARFKKIQKVLEHARFNSDPCNSHFGIRVSSTPMNVEGRVILPPKIRYHDDKFAEPNNGSWNMRSQKFLRGAAIKSWVLLSFASEIDCNIEDLNSFAELLVKIGGDFGLSLKNPECIRVISSNIAQLERVLKNIKTEFKHLELVVVVLQDRSSSFYSAIKQTSETVLGLVTQCVQVSNVSKLDLSIVSNICLKLNAKMGGINNSFTPGERPAIFEKPVIVIGADVTHPLPNSGFRPSIAAVVASLDSHPSRYAVALRPQRHANIKKQAAEIIQDLEQMIVDLLKTFYRETNQKKPEKIIFYRDGVSEGQLVEVRNYELRALRNACMRLGADYKPGITFIVVQKRHHTRFIPQNPKHGIGPKRNIPPGTVVDRGICSIINFDFFLCSHYGLQGTSRPSHYIVISDDNNFTSDELQKLTYYLCHIYVSCTKSISIPAPVMYAHLAAYRDSKYLEAKLGESSVSSDKISPAELQELFNTWKKISTVVPEMKNTMYFV